MAKGKYEKTRNSAPARAVKKKKGLSASQKAVIIIIAVIVIAAAVLFAFGDKLSGFFTSSHVERIKEGVSIAGIDVGGMTRSEAVEAVSKVTSSFAPDGSITVFVEDRSATVTADDIKSGVDVEGAVDKALKGEAGDDIKVDTVVQSDAGLNKKIAELAGSVATEKQDYTYRLSDTEVTLTIGQDGIFLDAEALCTQIVERFMAGDYSDLYAQTQEYTASMPDADAVYDQVYMSAKDAWYDPETFEIHGGTPGVDFDLKAFKDALANGTPGQTYTFPIRNVEPDITAEEAEAALYDEVLYEYTSPLTNIPNRTNNVRLAAEAINGTILYPGDEFNFNDIVGERTEDKGYKAADVYVGGDTTPQLGGGICQVASTIYVCTLYCNLEVTERQEHMYYVTYVPSGLDATIYWGSLNYRFINNKNFPIKIEAYQHDLELTVRFLGTKEDDTYVEMVSRTLKTDPFEEVEEVDETKEPDYRKVKVTGYTGYTVETTRNVYAGDGTLISSEQEAMNHYRRRDKIIIVGPKEEEILPDPFAPGFDPDYDPTVPGIPMDPIGPGGIPMDPVDPEYPGYYPPQDENPAYPPADDGGMFDDPFGV
ncbi:MAG: VanW family protein [Oscillospiraceae bacterium]|nr:VanW family protein [Oscillospiraceae bacterium]